jgi:hypothetical protein
MREWYLLEFSFQGQGWVSFGQVKPSKINDFGIRANFSSKTAIEEKTKLGVSEDAYDLIQLTATGGAAAGYSSLAPISQNSKAIMKTTNQKEETQTKIINPKNAGLKAATKVATQADVKAMQLPEGSQWQRNVLNSFGGGKAVNKKYEGGTELYRRGSNNGGFWSLDPPPLTEYQWRADFAIKQEFCNDASTLYKIKIPDGSSISGLDGIVGSQGNGLYGGVHQTYIDFKAIPESWIQTSPTNFIK